MLVPVVVRLHGEPQRGAHKALAADLSATVLSSTVRLLNHMEATFRIPLTAMNKVP